MDNAKLTRVSSINIIWVLVYTAQKQEIKYQKNNNRISLNIKKIINLNEIYFSIFFAFLIAIFIFLCCLIDRIFFSDKDNNFNIILTIAETTEEYNICGIWKKISKTPLSSWILCIVSSLKKNPLTVKYKENDSKNNDNLRENKLKSFEGKNVNNINCFFF